MRWVNTTGLEYHLVVHRFWLTVVSGFWHWLLFICRFPLQLGVQYPRWFFSCTGRPHQGHDGMKASRSYKGHNSNVSMRLFKVMIEAAKAIMQFLAPALELCMVFMLNAQIKNVSHYMACPCRTRIKPQLEKYKSDSQLLSCNK